MCKKLSQISTASNRQKHLGARGPTYSQGRSWLSAALHTVQRVFCTVVCFQTPTSRMANIFGQNCFQSKMYFPHHIYFNNSYLDVIHRDITNFVDAIPKLKHFLLVIQRDIPSFLNIMLHDF